MKQITKSKWWEMFEVLPPASYYKLNGLEGFQVGEPSNHDKDGYPMYNTFYQINDFYFEYRPLTTLDFRATVDDFDGFIGSDFDNASYAEECEEELTLLENYEQEQIDAYKYLFGGNGDFYFEHFEDSIAGQYDSDEEFAEDIADQLGLINNEVSWPYTCINWEHAASELMYDYAEHNGYYFRHI